MGWSGGTFTRVHDWTEDEAGGYDILSTRFEEEDDNFEAGINACLTKDGSNSPTADLPMDGRKHTGVGLGTARNHYATVSQVQDGAFKYNTASNNLNNYTLSVSPSPTVYTAGQQFNFKPTNTNSGATTLNVNSLGAKSIYSNGAPCAGGEIVTGRIYSVIYDGTQFHLVSGGGGSGASFGGACIFLTSPQNLPSQTSYSTVDFRAAAYNDGSAYYTPQTSYLKIPVTGRYRITASIPVEFVPGGGLITGAAYIAAYLRKNSSVMKSTISVFSLPVEFGDGSELILPGGQIVFEGPLIANDQIYLRVKQTNSYHIDVQLCSDGLVANSCYMSIERIY